MDCLSCKYLNESNKKTGALNGNLYYCSNIKKYVNTATYGCEDFQKAYSRNSFTKKALNFLSA